MNTALIVYQLLILHCIKLISVSLEPNRYYNLSCIEQMFALGQAIVENEDVLIEEVKDWIVNRLVWRSSTIDQST